MPSSAKPGRHGLAQRARVSASRPQAASRAIDVCRCPPASGGASARPQAWLASGSSDRARPAAAQGRRPSRAAAGPGRRAQARLRRAEAARVRGVPACSRPHQPRLQPAGSQAATGRRTSERARWRREQQVHGALSGMPQSFDHGPPARRPAAPAMQMPFELALGWRYTRVPGAPPGATASSPSSPACRCWASRWAWRR